MIMPEATITFNNVMQSAHNYQSFDVNEDFMVSEIHFTLKVADKQYENMHVEIRQPKGTDYEKVPIEVGKIIGPYKGTWNHNDFAALCEQYYRSQVGSMGHGIKFQGATQVEMRDNFFGSTVICKMNIPEDGATSW